MNEEESEKVTLDLSRKQLKKVPKQEDAQNVRVLILDENELQKIDNIDSYLKIETLSLSKNQLLRMYGVCRLHCLRELNLSWNGILSIEGLKECVHLRRLNLEGNNIKTIEHLNTNVKLEYLNLADNSIGSISDISFLKSLKELFLHGNRLTHLRQCDKYLPTSLEILTLARNNIPDLNEICTLANLGNLYSITISENPCVAMTNGTDGFDHRPFVLNWCMSVKVIDGFMVDPIESLKAEWLYSQGRGRQFRLGEQAPLAKYLSSVCPLIGKALENESERKLRLILSKAQQHQRQLQEEISEGSNTSGNNSPSSGRKKPSSRIQSPRFSRLGRQGSPESMVNSYHGSTSDHSTNHSLQMTTSLIENIKNESLMTQSFDNPVSLCGSGKMSSSQESTPRTITPNSYNDHSYNATVGPLAAASKMVPVPETLMSPDVCPSSVAQRLAVSAINTQLQNTKMIKNKDNKLISPKMRSPQAKRNVERNNSNSNSNNNSSPTMSPRRNNITIAPQQQMHQQTLQQNAVVKASGHMLDNQERARLAGNSTMVSAADVDSGTVSTDDEDESEHINIDKLKTIRNKAAQRCREQKEKEGNANLSLDTETCAVVIQKIWRGYRTRKKTKDIAEKLLKKRTNEYIEKLTKDMELTKTQLENERKIQQLQMQAINALWKKVSSMQGAPSVAASMATGAEGAGSSVEEQKSTINLDNNSTVAITDLTKTCTMLTEQVQQLQGSMRDILNCLTLFCNLPQENVKKLLSAGVETALSGVATTTTVETSVGDGVIEKLDSSGTQTEIVAVHTPQIENLSTFPYSKARPSSLPLTEGQPKKASVPLLDATTTSTATADEAREAQESGDKGGGENPSFVNEEIRAESPDDSNEQTVA